MNDTPMLPPVYLFTALAAMMLLHLFFPVLVLVSTPWHTAGLVPLALGVALNLVAGKSFMRSGNPIRAFEPPQTLVTGGVYRFSRNPMYLGMVLMLAGIAILLGSLTPFIIIPVFATAIDRVFIVAEEAVLEQRFGDQWNQYRRMVRRWL